MPGFIFLFLCIILQLDHGAADSIGDTLGGKQSKKHIPTDDELRSANGRYRMVMQSDCNLVFYGPNDKVLFASGTNGRGTLCQLFLLGGDSGEYGNVLQIRDYKSNIIWTYSHNSNGDCYLKVDNKGALLFPCRKVLSSKTITNPKKERTSVDTVGGPDCRGSKILLWTGGYVTSKNGAYRLTMQADCNLVLSHKDGEKLWESGTAKYFPGSLCTLNPIGPIDIPSDEASCFGERIVIKNYAYKTEWEILGNGYCGLTVENNGYLVFNCKAYVEGVGDPRTIVANAASGAAILLASDLMLQ